MNRCFFFETVNGLYLVECRPYSVSNDVTFFQGKQSPAKLWSQTNAHLKLFTAQFTQFDVIYERSTMWKHLLWFICKLHSVTTTTTMSSSTWTTFRRLTLSSVNPRATKHIAFMLLWQIYAFIPSLKWWVVAVESNRNYVFLRLMKFSSKANSHSAGC